TGLAIRPGTGTRPGAEELVLVRGQLAAGEPEAPAQREVHRVGRAGPVERHGDRRPPVDDRGRAVRRVHVPAADVEAVPGHAVVREWPGSRHFRAGLSQARITGFRVSGIIEAAEE